MDKYQEAIRQTVRALPAGSKRLKAGEVRAIAEAHGKNKQQVRKDVERLARRKDSGSPI
jgi:hypothetical protein